MVVNEGEGGLEGSNSVFFNESYDSRVCSSPAKSDNDYAFALDFVHRCDRRGFPFTSGSPRGPEPKHDVLTLKAVKIDLSPIEGPGWAQYLNWISGWRGGL